MDTPTVVSLLPATTEISTQLGVIPEAVSHTCDYPPAVKGQPVITEFDGEQYSLRESLLQDINPDVILTQSLCGECAIDSPAVEKKIEEMNLDSSIVSTHTTGTEDLFDNIQNIGVAVNRRSEAQSYVDKLRTRLDSLKTRTQSLAERPTVLVLDWIEPTMIARGWVPELVEIGGGIYDDMSQPPEIEEKDEWNLLRSVDPDIIIVAPCNYSTDESCKQLYTLQTMPEWSELTAVRNNEIYFMDGNHYVNRPGPRLIETARYFAGLIHPDRFNAPPSEVVRSISTVIQS